MIVEKQGFVFKASLQHVHDTDCFEAVFHVIAEDKFKARQILDEWLSKPEQTGYKYSCCVGVVQEASKFILIKENL